MPPVVRARASDGALWLVARAAFSPVVLDLAQHWIEFPWTRYAWCSRSCSCAARGARSARGRSPPACLGDRGARARAGAAFAGAIRWARPGSRSRSAACACGSGSVAGRSGRCSCSLCPRRTSSSSSAHRDPPWRSPRSPLSVWRVLGVDVESAVRVLDAVSLHPNEHWLALAPLLAGLAWYEGMLLARPVPRMIAASAACGCAGRPGRADRAHGRRGRSRRGHRADRARTARRRHLDRGGGRRSRARGIAPARAAERAMSSDRIATRVLVAAMFAVAAITWWFQLRPALEIDASRLGGASAPARRVGRRAGAARIDRRAHAARRPQRAAHLSQRDRARGDLDVRRLLRHAPRRPARAHAGRLLPLGGLADRVERVWAGSQIPICARTSSSCRGAASAGSSTTGTAPRAPPCCWACSRSASIS